MSGGNPVDLDGTVTMVRRFSESSGDMVLGIEDRFYRLYFVDQANYYMMVRCGHFSRSLRGSLDRLEEAAVKLHRIYRAYEARVRRAKEEAQRERDRHIHAVAETFV